MEIATAKIGGRGRDNGLICIACVGTLMEPIKQTIEHVSFKWQKIIFLWNNESLEKDTICDLSSYNRTNPKIF